MRIFYRFFEALSRGDPVALGALVVFLIIFAAFGLLWWRLARKVRQEDEAKKGKWKKPGSSKRG